MPIGADLVLQEESSPEEVLLDGERLGQVVEKAARRYRTPLAFPLMDLGLEKADLARFRRRAGRRSGPVPLQGAANRRDAVGRQTRRHATIFSAESGQSGSVAPYRREDGSAAGRNADRPFFSDDETDRGSDRTSRHGRPWRHDASGRWRLRHRWYEAHWPLCP